ncbi:pyridoxamine kinase [Oribacterium sp. FC2011]|uniref:pyridoxamine kinase n=1 Tax=Oribacterium sp. FC2011 TaxID=1408311 RepID=UPI0004E22CEB|nr:pyridoxamine kinase [Oribacterium sp. FC2011]
MKKLAVINDLSGVGRSSLSIQLPVVSTLSVTACPVPTAILSSHTAFKEVAKVDFKDHLSGFFDAWNKNGFSFDGILIGYLGDTEEHPLIEDFIREQKKRNPELTVILDPVMADNGSLYRHMTQKHIEAMLSLAKYADLLTPNLTEAALLADFDYEGMKETLKDCKLDAAKGMVFNSLLSALHHITPGAIIVTGIEEENEAGEKMLLNVLSETDGDLRFIRNPRTGNGRPGTGDLFSAIISAKLLKGTDHEKACRSAADFVGLAIKHSEELNVPVIEGVQFEDLLRHLSDSD